MLLYNYATNHFQQRSYSPASRFFQAAHLYAQEGKKAKTARVMAVCNIATGSLDRYCKWSLKLCLLCTLAASNICSSQL